MVTADAVPQAGKDNKEQNGGIYIRDQVLLCKKIEKTLILK